MILKGLWMVILTAGLMVTEMKSPRGERVMEEAIANGLLMENDKKQMEKPSNLTENEFSSMIVRMCMRLSE